MGDPDNNAQLYSPAIHTLGDYDYKRLSEFIMSQYGIKLPPVKKIMVQSRLQKRLKFLQLGGFKEYVDYVFSPEGQKKEVPYMIDAVSTNKTDFFREPSHFEYLMNQGLPSMIDQNTEKLKIWSAGCSSGEEPYTIAMVLKEYLGNHHYPDYSILATDISNSVLELAKLGIYTNDKVAVINHTLKKKYLLKGKNKYQNKVRVIQDIRRNVNFQKFNLLSSNYHSFGFFDIIFCRNVLIYFEREIQYRVISRFCEVLRPGGLLFLGHSESITGMELPLQIVKPTIFIKK